MVRKGKAKGMDGFWRVFEIVVGWKSRRKGRGMDVLVDIVDLRCAFCLNFVSWGSRL